jgi:hypothetical protein
MFSKREYIDTLEHLYGIAGGMDKKQQLAGLFSGAPARLIGPGGRGMRGAVKVLGKLHRHESFLERDFLYQMTLDRSLSAIKAQPVTVEFENRGKNGKYTPDYATQHNGPPESRFLVELKFREDLMKDWKVLKPRLLAGRQYAREHGLRHIILTEKEIRTQSLENAMLLAPYREIADDESIEKHLIYRLAGLGGEATPNKLLAAAYASESNRKEASDFVFKLIAQGRIHADLDTPVNKIMPIWLDMSGNWRGDCNPYWRRPVMLRTAKIIATGTKNSAAIAEDKTWI